MDENCGAGVLFVEDMRAEQIIHNILSLLDIFVCYGPFWLIIFLFCASFTRGCGVWIHSPNFRIGSCSIVQRPAKHGESSGEYAG